MVRTNYEPGFRRTVDSVYPSASMLERQLPEVEKDGFAAQPLTEVLTAEVSGEEAGNFTEVGSRVSFRMTNNAFLQPNTSKRLGKRFKTLAMSFIMVAYNHSSRPDQCTRFALDQEGAAVAVSWTTILY